MSCDWLISFCPKCGNIEILGIDDTCEYCGSSLRKTEYSFDNAIEHGNLKPEIRKAILENYIKNNPAYSEEYAKQREEKQSRERLNLPSSYKPKENNIPKCPTCGSTNIEKISATSKAIGFATIGIFSSNFGKTMHCKNCGYKW